MGPATALGTEAVGRVLEAVAACMGMEDAAFAIKFQGEPRRNHELLGLKSQMQ